MGAAEEILAGAAAAVEDALDRLLPKETEDPAEPGVLFRSMRYSALGGGKRLRAALTLAAARAVAGPDPAVAAQAVVVAAAIEMIHAYSLIHDDLPCMDDDDFRRGRPSNHRVFGEALAMLAGDSLLTHAFAVLARLPEYGADDKTAVAVIRCLAEAAGPIGMAGGQAMDLAAEGTAVDLSHLAAIHRRKTGALITASVLCGGLVAGASAPQREALGTYGNELGLSFQIIDDILDVAGEIEHAEKVAGNMTGSDARLRKATYPALIGVARSRELAAEARDRALAALGVFAGRSRELTALALFVTARDR